jgi:hypothetical protein
MAFTLNGTSTPTATRLGQTGPGGLSLQAGPLPATSSLTARIANLKEAGTLSLTDATGRQVYQGALASGATEATVSVEHLAAGTYLMELRTPQGSVRQRILKQ